MVANRTSIIIVNYNGRHFLHECLSSVTAQTYKDIEVILVDNASTDESAEYVHRMFPPVKVIENKENRGFAGGINDGIRIAKGDYIVTLNNDTIVDPKFAEHLLKAMDADDTLGMCAPKILFPNGRIDSTGICISRSGAAWDRGMFEQDAGRFDIPEEVFGPCAGAALYRKKMLDEIGLFDEDFFLFMEDVDLAFRARLAGWKCMFVPSARITHIHGGTAGYKSPVSVYYGNRNIIWYTVKNFPLKTLVICGPWILGRNIGIIPWYLFSGMTRLLIRSKIDALRGIKKMIRKRNTIRVTVPETKIRQWIKPWADFKRSNVATMGKNLPDDCSDYLQMDFPTVRPEQYPLKGNVPEFENIGNRKIRLGIYDHAFHFAGGGQKYAAKLAEILQDRYEITYIINKKCSFSKYKEWFDIDLSGCRQKVIEIPFFEQKNSVYIDERMVINEPDNPFDIISEESKNYDIFINANMLTKVKPRSAVSIFICHFPDREKERFFQVDNYDYIITNGKYPSCWLKKRWGFQTSLILYPPVDMMCNEPCLKTKQPIILSSARFVSGGSKKQFDMIKIFEDICNNDARIHNTWSLVLAGGVDPRDDYLKQIQKEINSWNSGNIILKPDVTYSELKELYRNAAIFWHACGLNETAPHLIEHFGMTTVEAMQNYCDPIVFDGGGQKEIVDHGVNGLRFRTADELKEFTLSMMNNEQERENIANKAIEKSKIYSSEIFEKEATDFFNSIEKKLTGNEPLKVS
jgi:O-antigen biosynthesis protein